MSQNPYQSPSDLTPTVERQAIPKDAPVSIPRSLLMWCCVCSVTAIPSLLLGTAISETPFAIPAMCIGILFFAIGYTVVDVLYLRTRVRQNPALRKTLWIGYIIRMAVSAGAPLGVMLDMWPGMLSVGLTQLIFGGGALSSFIQVLFTTLVQGVLMNAILLAVLLPIYAVCRMAGIPNYHSDPITETEPANPSDAANPFKTADTPETANPFATTDDASLQSG